jgi:hypothetical protein
MGGLREALHRVRSFLQKEQRDLELDAEVAAHLELAVEENMRHGMSAEEARRQALIRFGGVVQAKELQREVRGLPWLDVLLQDLRYTFRTLRRDRGFTVVAVLILGLGIGANITVFSVVNTLLLRPLPFRDPQQLVRILTTKVTGGESSMTYSTDATEELQRRNRSFQEVTGYFAFSPSDNIKLIGQGQPEPVTGLLVAGNFFHTLGVEPSLGRLFTPEECVRHSRPVALLSHDSMAAIRELWDKPSTWMARRSLSLACCRIRLTSARFSLPARRSISTHPPSSTICATGEIRWRWWAA